MSTQTPDAHLTHDELSTPAELARDCRAVGTNLRLDRIHRAATSTPPSIHFDDFPREVRKRDISIDTATARLAAALHLHLD